MSPFTFFIRPATPMDADTIVQLIYELALYEKQPESAKATPQLLQQNLFDKPIAHALLAVAGSVEEPGETIGLAIYFFNFSTWTARTGLYLDDLYVKPDFQNKGVGKAFFYELGKIAREKNCARIDWSVLKWNQPSIGFYEKTLGAKTMSEWVGMRLEEAEISSLEQFGRSTAE